jgi:sulfite exporter TauE/SafE
MTSSCFAILLSGIVGGFGHCISMCGPLVATFSLGNTKTGMLQHLLYNIGRITTYTILGGLVGLSGSLLALTASIQRIQTAILVLSGISIIIMGMATADLLPLSRRIISCSTSSITQNILTHLKGPKSVSTYYPIGIILGFLPCGLTYTALLTAARSAMDAQNPFSGMLQGAFMMLLFGTGTFPALILVGKVTHHVSNKTQKRFYRVASLIMVATGISFVISAL